MSVGGSDRALAPAQLALAVRHAPGVKSALVTSRLSISQPVQAHEKAQARSRRPLATLILRLFEAVMQVFLDGRGWFRTNGLSRVKHVRA